MNNSNEYQHAFKKSTQSCYRDLKTMDENIRMLDFEIPEHVPWRQPNDLTSIQKLKYIQHVSEQSQEMSKEFLDEFRIQMAALFVCEMNKAYSVGLQSYEEVLQTLINQCDSKLMKSSIEEQATLNIAGVLNEETRSYYMYMCVEKIEEFQRAVLPQQGTLRSCQTGAKCFTTKPDGTIHFYPSGLLVRPMLEGVIQQHNIHMAIYKGSKDKISFLLKSAAWLIARFIAIHPFPDGNERTSNLLANHVLSQVIPFPVHVYKTGEVDRQHYIDAIIECQNEHQHPQNLSALLVDSVYNGMKKMKEEYQQWMAHRKCVIIPVKHKSSDDEVCGQVQQIFRRVTEKDRHEIQRLCLTKVQGEDCYKQIVLHDKRNNIDYIVRKFSKSTSKSLYY